MRSVLLFFLLISIQPVLASEKITLIAHLSATLIPHTLAPKKIKNIYLLKQRNWPDETPIIVVTRRATDPLRQKFEQALGLNRKKYALYLRKMHYKGVRLPLIQNSRQAVLDFVENVPGTISYIEGFVPNTYQHINNIGELQ
ncbi:MAG: hypothetical protein QM500_00205 [Methylococcales bacterium]